MSEIKVNLDPQHIKKITTLLLKKDIQSYLDDCQKLADQYKERGIIFEQGDFTFSVTDVVGTKWDKTENGEIYQAIFWPMYKNMTSASQQLGRLFRQATKDLGLESKLIDDGKGRKKLGYVLPIK